jgi:hypothetical protein
VTIGLATALQESKLRNLDYGDLDSLGLFQQRPSQGWGTSAQILTPSYAAAAFFQHLAQVPGWETMSVAEAAQAVQHSAAGSAYAAWEPQARVMAQALTGEVPAAWACHVQVKAATSAGQAATVQAAMVQAATSELGPVDWAGSVSSPFGWVVASWLIGHAQQYQVSSVAYAGWKWTAGGGSWTPDTSATTHIVVHG